MYYLVTIDSESIKKAKGVNKNVVKIIRHKEYVDELFGRGLPSHKMQRIQSRLHRIGTYDVCKISLPCFDDKPCIFDDGVSSFVYIHKEILD